MNLVVPAAPFAELALEQLKDVRAHVLKSVAELKPHLDPDAANGIDTAAEQAIVALEAYRDWLTQTAAGDDCGNSRGTRRLHVLSKECGVVALYT